jgi:hypothetical protein
MPNAVIDSIRREQEAYDRDPEGYERYKREWSLDACIERGCLPTGEPLEAAFGVGPWTDYGPEPEEEEPE